MNVGSIVYSCKRWQGWKNLFKMLNVKCWMDDLFVLCLIKICYWVENLSCFCLFVFFFFCIVDLLLSLTENFFHFYLNHIELILSLISWYWKHFRGDTTLLLESISWVSQVFPHVFPFFLWQKHRVRCNLPYDDESVFLKMQIISIKRTINKLLNYSPVRCCLVVLPIYSM